MTVNIGMIRFDALCSTSTVQGSAEVGMREAGMLSFPLYADRVPYYGQQVSPTVVLANMNTQDIVDRELQMFARNGIGHAVYCWYPQSPDMGFGLDVVTPFGIGICGGMLKHRASAYKNLVKWTFISPLLPLSFTIAPTLALWNASVNYIIDAMVNDSAFYYINVGGVDRPVMYMMFLADTQGIGSIFGSAAAMKAALDAFRAAVVAATGVQPYLIGQLNDSRCLAVAALDATMFDSWSQYCSFPSNTNYNSLAGAEQAAWASTVSGGKKLIPYVTTGWGFQPRSGIAGNAASIAWATMFNQVIGPEEQDPNGIWAMPTDYGSAVNQVAQAVAFVEANPTPCEANSILVYSWNELTEGGSVCPKRDSDGFELKYITLVLERQYEPARSLRYRGIEQTTR